MGVLMSAPVVLAASHVPEVAKASMQLFSGSVQVGTDARGPKKAADRSFAQHECEKASPLVASLLHNAKARLHLGCKIDLRSWRTSYDGRSSVRQCTGILRALKPEHLEFTQEN